jgi:CDP-2,3-bis-(O-geranylgeranyl)-sn-glycerol synthase
MAELLRDILIAFWVFLPAGISNMAPVLAAKLPLIRGFNSPLDFGKSFRGIRFFGANKTWRGLFAGIVMATLTGYVQYYVFTDLHPLSDGPLWIMLVASALLGAGALLGDAVESFFKRRADVPPGQSWFPFDQTDYIIGGLLLWAPIAQPPVQVVLAIFGLYFGLHLLVSYIGYLLGLKDKPI